MALHLIDDQKNGVSVKTSCELKKADVVANISKTACLNIKTSCAYEIIESPDLAGSLGLSMALMYKRDFVPWAGYLQLFPIQEDLPPVWSLIWSGTEVHKICFTLILITTAYDS